MARPSLDGHAILCDTVAMDYRSIEIHWMPHTRAQWGAFVLSRKEAARLWADLVERHHRIRRLGWRWPSKARWQQWAKGRYPGLSAQSVQQIIGEFCEAVNGSRHLRTNGHPEANYPWKKPRYRDVVYTNQDARIRRGVLLLPNGRSGLLRVRLPQDRPLPGRLMEVRVCMGRILLICAIEEHPRPQRTVVGVDLGVNTLIAATDGQRALLISGRQAKATLQRRNKNLAAISARQSRKARGSRRWKRLQRRKAQLLAKDRRRLNDLIHKATRHVADAFPGATCYVGEPFNDAAQTVGRVQAQQVSQVANARVIQQLDYKTCGAIQVDEAYTSQTCPSCGERKTCKRLYRCSRCGIVAPRDVVGATNILSVGRTGAIQQGAALPTDVQFRHPVKSKVSRSHPGSSGGHPASSSPPARSPRL
jgi:putative transposase